MGERGKVMSDVTIAVVVVLLVLLMLSLPIFLAWSFVLLEIADYKNDKKGVSNESK